jgi:hypothetical protein
MCLVWNSMLTNKDCFTECALLGGTTKGMAIPVNRMVQEGPLWETLAMQEGPLWGNLSMAGHTT